MSTNEPPPEPTRIHTTEPPPKRTRIQVTPRVLLVAGIAVLIALVLVGYLLPFTGFFDLRGKTFWDWLDLLVVPVGLAVVAYLFSRANARTEREAASQREKIDRDIASNNAQEALLQSYLDRMTDLLLEKELQDPGEETPVQVVARARTVTVLRRLDQVRRASLLTFLHESKLIGKNDSVRLLAGADLSGAQLGGADLSWAYLRKADLSNAILGGANLSEVNLRGAIYDARIKWPDGFKP